PPTPPSELTGFFNSLNQPTNDPENISLTEPEDAGAHFAPGFFGDAAQAAAEQALDNFTPPNLDVATIAHTPPGYLAHGPLPTPPGGGNTGGNGGFGGQIQDLIDLVNQWLAHNGFGTTIPNLPPGGFPGNIPGSMPDIPNFPGGNFNLADFLNHLHLGTG